VVDVFTAGKCHDRGFIAFDWQSTDTCHGVGQALHKSLCSFVVMNRLFILLPEPEQPKQPDH
jgi:hypothetical protein